MNFRKAIIRTVSFIDEERDKKLHLAKSNASPGCSLVLGFFVMLFSAFGYVVYFLASPAAGILWSPVANFILAIVTIGYFSFKHGWKGDAKPKSPLEYSPKKIYKSSIFDLINMFIFVVSFFGIFFSLGETSFSIFGGICLFFSLFGLFNVGVNNNKTYKENKFFGASRVEVETPNAKIGETISIQFFNEMLQEKLFEVDIVFRNIQEHWVIDEKDKKKKNKKLETIVLYEEAREVQVVGDTINLDFEIPNDKVKPTDYAINNPTYWELEVSNKSIGYYCRFFIDVLPHDEVILEESLALKLKEKVV